MAATDVRSDASTDVDHDDHPTPQLCVRVAGVLFVLTALEFSTYYIDFAWMHAPLLLGLMAIKFAMVVGFFMHLKYDTRLFTRLMGVGLGGAIVLYAITFAAMAETPAGMGLN
jgi:cytochrome c oxidase subunit 4